MLQRDLGWAFHPGVMPKMKARPTACPIILARTTAVTKMSQQQGKNYGTPRMHHVLSAVRCIKLRFKYSRPELVLVVVFH